MSDEERRFEPTRHHLEEMRKRGEVALSRDLVSALALLLAVGMFSALGEYLCAVPARAVEQAWSADPWLQMTPQRFAAYWNGWAATLLSCVFAVLVWIPLTVVGASLLQTRGLFLPKKVFPDAARISPAAGLGRLFSSDAAAAVVAGMVKILLVAGTLVWVCVGQLPRLFDMYGQSFPDAVATLRRVLLGTGWKIAGVLLALAVADYAWQYHRHRQRVKMTYEQLREEIRVERGGRT